MFIPAAGIPPQTGAPAGSDGYADLVIYQGDDYLAVVMVSSPTLPPEQVILGYSAAAQIRRDFADNADVIADMTTQVNSPYITIALSNSQTVAMHDTYVWDLQITSPGGVVTTILRGNVQITQEVTRGAAPPVGETIIVSLPGAMLPGASLPGGSPPQTRSNS